MRADTGCARFSKRRSRFVRMPKLAVVAGDRHTGVWASSDTSASGDRSPARRSSRLRALPLSTRRPAPRSTVPVDDQDRLRASAIAMRLGDRVHRGGDGRHLERDRARERVAVETSFGSTDDSAGGGRRRVKPSLTSFGGRLVSGSSPASRRPSGKVPGRPDAGGSKPLRLDGLELERHARLRRPCRGSASRADLERQAAPAARRHAALPRGRPEAPAMKAAADSRRRRSKRAPRVGRRR